jgi:DNA-binding MarR family transcriptional regulator
LFKNTIFVATNMDIDFLKILLDQAAAYQAAGGRTTAADFNDFVRWMARGQALEAPQSAELPGVDPGEYAPLEGLVAMHLSFMARYADFYGRRLFRHSEVYSLDDWSVLVTLYPQRQMKKTEVIQQTIMEKSSGNEVLKRLLRQGLLEEVPNPADRRSKLLALTPAGRSAFESLSGGIARLSKQVVADLDQAEQQHLLALLQKLHRYHWEVFTAGKQ